MGRLISNILTSTTQTTSEAKPQRSKSMATVTVVAKETSPKRASSLKVRISEMRTSKGTNSPHRWSVGQITISPPCKLVKSRPSDSKQSVGSEPTPARSSSKAKVAKKQPEPTQQVQSAKALLPRPLNVYQAPLEQLLFCDDAQDMEFEELPPYEPPRDLSGLASLVVLADRKAHFGMH